MARSKNKSPATHHESKATLLLEDHIHLIEKRLNRLESRHKWQTSLPYRTVVSVAIYVASAFLLMSLMIPGWYIGALIPVSCYWLALISLFAVRRPLVYPRESRSKVTLPGRQAS